MSAATPGSSGAPMLGRERVAAAFRLEPTDKVPIYQAGFSSRAASLVLGREAFVGGGIQQYREARALMQGGYAHAEFLERSFTDAAELCEKLDLDLVRTGYWRKEEKPIAALDELTFQYANGEVWRFDPPTETYGCVSNPLPAATPEELTRLADQEVREAEAFAPTEADFPEHQRAVERFGATRAIPGGGVSIAVPRDDAWLEAIVVSPDVVGRMLDAQVIRAQKCAPVMARLGLPYCFGGGDFAGRSGPFYSPRFFHQYMLPRLSLISEACHAAGVFHLFASDGDLWPVARDLFGASGVDGYYEVDGNFMPLARLRDAFPRLKLLGGIRSEVLHRGTEDEVRREAKTAVETARQIRGCIVGCSNQIVAPTPERNLWAMIETVDRYR